jgi:hypothetical protein
MRSRGIRGGCKNSGQKEDKNKRIEELSKDGQRGINRLAQREET